jgi:predicted enzyme related to lactoylglutathione lyase
MPARENAPAGGPCWVDLMTSDTERSREFYGQLFGWTADEPAEEFGGYVNFKKDGILVAGCMPREPGPAMPDAWSVYLATDDAVKTLEAAVAGGGQVVAGAMAVGDLGTMAIITDVGGAAIGIWQPGLHRGFGILGEPGTPSWFELHTRDYQAVLGFYRDVFGWDIHVVGDTPDFRYAIHQDGEVQLAGIMDASGFLPEGVPAHWAVYFGAEDADATAAKIADLGGSILMAPEDTPYGRLATAVDPTGAQFKIAGPNAATPAEG